MKAIVVLMGFLLLVLGGGIVYMENTGTVIPEFIMSITVVSIAVAAIVLIVEFISGLVE